VSLTTATRLLDRARCRLEADGDTEPATIRAAVGDLYDAARELLQLASDLESGLEP
jgi:hypothetical protein